MRHAHTDDTCVAARGRARKGLPPFVAFLVVLTACSSGGRETTTGSTALTIPRPFEAGQQIGLGTVALEVAAFRRVGGVLTIHLHIANEAPQPVSLRPTAFTVFYGSSRHLSSSTTGFAQPIGASGTAFATLVFSVPAQYPYPLLWFDGSVPGARPGTIVFRGTSG